MIIYGKNPVIEALSESTSDVDELILNKNINSPVFSEIIKLAKAKSVKISYLPKEALERLSEGGNHQGVLAKVRDFQYSDLSKILNSSPKSGKYLTIVILDHIEDPHNLGAIVRTAEFLGANGVIIPKDRAAAVTPTVLKASSGAVHHMPIARVVNIPRTIKELKNKGLWIAGADSSSKTSLYNQDYTNLDLALVIGSEGRGISKSVRDSCDFLLSIPKLGNVSSLNASVAAGMMLYEIIRQRNTQS